jgi:glycosyltransferase involved in cell wall biosynthesis
VIELLWALDQIRCVRDDVYLLVIGDGDARPLFERYARLYEIADHVRFLGWRTDAAAIIAGLDVYCTASLQTGCSLAVLEAMARRVPVVAADTPPHRQVITNGETGFLVDTRQRSEMARWCLRMLEDEESAHRMREAAKRRAVEQFSIQPFVAHYRDLYARGDG